MLKKEDFTAPIIEKAIDAIKQNAGDPNWQHCMEDVLYGQFVQYASIYCKDIDTKVYAIRLLKTKSIKFDRWGGK